MTGDALRLSVLGTTFSLAGERSLLAQLRALWSPFPAGESAEVADINLAADHLGSATSDINRMALDAYSDFAAHAGVVRLGTHVIAMPAESGTGKTTMVAACVAVGGTYVSDEALCVRYDDRLVEPFPKPLALSPWSARAVGLTGGIDVGEEVLATAADLGGAIAADPLSLTDVVRLYRVPDADPVLTLLHRADAVPLLLAMSFNHYRNRAEAFALVTYLAQRCRTWELRYSDPMAAARLLRGGLDQPD